MSKAEFTPGPWKCGREDHCNESDSDYIEIDAVGPSHESGLAIVFLGHPTGPQYMRDGGHANAHLIAAAPELVEALDACFDLIAADYKDHMAWPHAYHLAEAALAKARGEAT